jgi:hypothetical protein
MQDTRQRLGGNAAGRQVRAAQFQGLSTIFSQPSRFFENTS